MATETSNTKTPEFNYESNPLAIFFGQFSILSRNIKTVLALYGVTILFIFLLAFVFGFIVFVLAAALGETMSSLFILTPLIGVLIFTAIIFSSPIQAAFLGYSLATVRGQQFTFSDATKVAMKRGFGLLGLNILYGLMILGGLILFIVPAFIFAYWYVYAQILYIDDTDLTISGAFSKSKEITKGKFWELAGLFGVNLLLQTISSLPIVGGVVSALGSWVFSLSFAHRYASDRYITELNIEKPPSHWSNYFLAIAAPIVFAFIISLVILVSLIESFTS